MCLHLSDVKQEFCELVDEKDAKEEKEVDDIEDADKLLQDDVSAPADLGSTNAQLYVELSCDELEFDPGVLLPPPENTVV